MDRVLDHGWKSLSSKETGRIGGMITKRKKQEEMKEDTVTGNKTALNHEK